jgi:hypothetical protein
MRRASYAASPGARRRCRFHGRHDAAPARPCALGGGDVLTQESAAAHVSDLAELEALADRFGFPVGDGKVADLFTQPDAVRRSAAAA